MKVSLIGTEYNETLGLRYMASALEARGHEAKIIPFNLAIDIPYVIDEVSDYRPEILGLSMVYTHRAREFCSLAHAIRESGFRGHIIAGGHFASFNSYNLLRDFSAFDSIAIGEGEDLICNLADNLSDLSKVSGLYYRKPDRSISFNPCQKNADNLDALKFPKRTNFPIYFGKPLANVIASRGCWRDCAFCSINAWYDRIGCKKFRVRSIDNVAKELKYLYFEKGVRIFDFQDDNFFLPDPKLALQRFETLRDTLHQADMKKMGIIINARTDCIRRDSVAVLDEIGLIGVFLGVDNASENGLRNLNRRSTIEQSLDALNILNDFDIHVSFNLLLFEPDTVMDDLRINLKFIERHIDNPFNLFRADVYAGTGLENKLKAEGRLLGDYFILDYGIKDASAEVFYQIVYYAFKNRIFGKLSLNKFCMELDFFFHLLQHFHQEIISKSMRSSARNLIKLTNLDTYHYLCRIYDFVESIDLQDKTTIKRFAQELRGQVDGANRDLYKQGLLIRSGFKEAYDNIGLAYNYQNARFWIKPSIKDNPLREKYFEEKIFKHFFYFVNPSKE